MTTPSRGLAYGALIVQTMISAFTYLAAKRALLDLPPTALIMLRLAGSSLCFVVLLLVTTRQRWPPRDTWGQIVLLGLLAVPLNQGLFIDGLTVTTPAHAALMYALTPVFVFAGALIFRTERAEPRKVAGLLLALSGAAVVVLERAAGSQKAASLPGDLEILAGAVAWAGYTVLGKPLVARLGPVAATSWTLIVGTLLFIPIGLPATLRVHAAGHAPVVWWSLAFLIFFTSVIAYLAWFYALGMLDASRVAIFSNLQPVMTAIASWLIFGEQMTPRLMAGGGLVIAGVLITTRVVGRLRAAPALAD